MKSSGGNKNWTLLLHSGGLDFGTSIFRGKVLDLYIHFGFQSRYWPNVVFLLEDNKFVLALECLVLSPEAMSWSCLSTRISHVLPGAARPRTE